MLASRRGSVAMAATGPRTGAAAIGSQLLRSGRAAVCKARDDQRVGRHFLISTTKFGSYSSVLTTATLPVAKGQKLRMVVADDQAQLAGWAQWEGRRRGWGVGVGTGVSVDGTCATLAVSVATETAWLYAGVAVAVLVALAVSVGVALGVRVGVGVGVGWSHALNRMSATTTAATAVMYRLIGFMCNGSCEPGRSIAQLSELNRACPKRHASPASAPPPLARWALMRDDLAKIAAGLANKRKMW